ncbi:T9SS type A sorting domain-containing protein [Flavobacterium sp.]|uniref:T9SS type A sorting domain-containing protein n=1 Tax=Flavobacterium sp. TaxID=239 RepID=UPI00375060B6
MKKFYTLPIILLAFLSFGQTPISLIGVNVPYSEDFNGMGSTQTDFIPGWTAINVANGATLTMAVTDGSASVGNVYNVGAVGSEERSFGTLADVSIVPAIGAVFTNNTGGTVSKIAIQTRMEQWKESDNTGINETVAFSYSLDATSLNTGTWTTVSALDLKEKLTAATTNLAVNGNLLANYTNLANIITGLNWTNGTNLWIKWMDVNDAGSNGLYAIDNFTISVSEATLGLKQNTITGLNMYPNPVSNGTLYITSNSSEEKKVSVYDVLGKQILESKTSNNAVNVSTLNSGAYIVKITESGKTDTRKLIVQ